MFLLVGTYDLLALRNLSGQLGRRCQEVHFPRYRIEDAEDWEQFRSVVNTFAAQLPTDPNLLVGDAESMYAGSAGCVGTLKQWLTRALVLALKDGSEMTKSHLEQTTLSVAARTEIAAEILRGEAAMYESVADRAQLNEMLGLKVPRSGADPSPARRSRIRVGRRRPHRDPVGASA